MTGIPAPDLSPRLTAAFEIARRAHNGTALRGTNVPYLLHVLEVSAILLRHGGDEDQTAGALLHDVVEDGGGEPLLAEIRDEFGDRVADIVLGCSDSLEVDPKAKLPWWPRKIAYIDHMHVATPDVAMVSVADKLANVRSIVADLDVHGDAVWDNFRTGRVGTLWYYRRIADILPPRLADADQPRRLGATLVSTVHELVEAVGASTAAVGLARRRRRGDGTPRRVGRRLTEPIRSRGRGPAGSAVPGMEFRRQRLMSGLRGG